MLDHLGKDSSCWEISIICVRCLEKGRKKIILTTYFTPLYRDKLRDKKGRILTIHYSLVLLKTPN